MNGVAIFVLALPISAVICLAALRLWRRFVEHELPAPKGKLLDTLDQSP